jgi:hypothetical protein
MLLALPIAAAAQGADVPPPPAADAQRLFAAAWPRSKCAGYDITEVRIDGEPRLRREAGPDPASARWWYAYTVELSARGTGMSRTSEFGAIYRSRVQNTLIWDAGARSWSVDAGYLRCGGWARVR